MSRLEIFQFPCRSDNYGVLVHEPRSGETASIDAPDAAAVEAALAEKGWKLTRIFTTHHHGDHTAGNLELKARHGCKITGPKGEAEKIPGIDRAVGDGAFFSWGGHEVRVLETPGHTLGHISYWFPHDNVAFVGDTMFAMGCGRVFEGTPEMMWRSLEKLRALPPETVVYCGHEYTQSNARFALGVDPDNEALQARAAKVDALRAEGKPTLPTTIAEELATNPFLRADDPGIRRRLGLERAESWQVFAEVRKRKDVA